MTARASIIAVLGAVVLTTSGCGWRSPRVQFYTLAPLAERAEPASSPGTGPALAVGPATFPRFLERPHIVRREGARLVLDDFNRWGGSFEAEVLRVLGDDLALLLDSNRVAVYPASAPFEVAYRVLLDVLQFDGRPGDAVVLRARWTIQPGAGGGPLAVEQSTIREPVASGDVEALVDAHGAALATLAREIAARVREIDTRPETATP